MANGLLDSLVAYWTLDDTNWLDSHTNNHDLTAVGSPTNSAGIINNGYNVSSISTNRLEIASPPAVFLPGDTSFSVACWARFNIGGVGLNHPHIAVWDSSADPDVDDSWLFWQRLSACRFSISSDGTSEESFVASSVIADDAAWRFYAGGYDSNLGQIWVSVNGGTKTTAAHTGGAFSGSAAPLSIGFFNGSSFIGGSQDLDEVGFWTKVLSSADLTTLYNSGSGFAFSNFDSIANGILPIRISYAKRKQEEENNAAQRRFRNSSS